MELWHRLRYLELTWTALFGLVACWVGVLFLRRLLPEGRRDRGRWSAYGLGAAPLLHLLATGVSLVGLPAVGATLHLANVALVVASAAGVLSMLLFDVALARTRFAVPDIVRGCAHLLLLLVVLVSVLRGAGIDPLSIVTTSAVATAVVGLAMQNALANVGAGVLFQIDRTFRLGDWIQLGGRVGRVEAFEWRSTSLRTPGGDLAIVPNVQILATEVLNLSRPKLARRLVTKVPFHRSHFPREVADVVTAALRGVDGVLAEPPPACCPVEFGASSITYQATCWIDHPEHQDRVEADVHTRIWYAAWRAGLEGPCPARAEPTERELTDRRGALAAVGLLAPLDPAQRDGLAPSLRPMPYLKGERIIAEGDAGDSMFFLAEGSVSVEVARESGPRALATLRPGDAFGEMSLLTGEPRRATCHAASDCLCYAIDADAFRALLASDPTLAEALTGLVAQREREATRPSRDPASEGAERDAAHSALWGRVRTYFRL